MSGVTAAKAGGMAALGAARAGESQLLDDAEADPVVTTLDDLDLGGLEHGRLARMPRTASAQVSNPERRHSA